MISKAQTEVDFPKVSPLALVEQAARLMRDHRLHALPVVEGRQLKGVIACEDIVYRGIADGDDWFLAHVEDYMTTDPDVAFVTDGISTIQAAMRVGRHQWLPVVSADDEYQGVVILSALEFRNHC
ncbi:CBS domain-containing protein [Aurantiacibacter zhengii]|uniref:CBS domain-containing protein n=1 Tax=Aurantiacibacter zhengii TaxID=2307003 RepID=A0A418NQ60_9SPHN|nr:CBS domain-containing protein [Aurantiacibacter zhengii]RIV84608.1 CBS domain-containing protein [Aurantiacibacter zhengii]